jgi:hypothetical protein
VIRQIGIELALRNDAFEVVLAHAEKTIRTIPSVDFRLGPAAWSMWRYTLSSGTSIHGCTETHGSIIAANHREE